MSKYQSVVNDTTKSTPPHPLESASLFSKLTFAWATPLLATGNERQLDPADLWPLQPEHQSTTVASVFEPTFRRTHSLLWSIAVTHGPRFVLIGGMQVFSVGCTLYGPVVLKHVLAAVETDTAFDLKAVLWLIGSLCVVNVAQALVTAHLNIENQLVAAKITSALQSLLFRKSLRLSSRRDTTAGEIANMFATDVPSIVSLAQFANQLWLMPLQVIVIMVLLYGVIGWATFVGLAVIGATLLANHATMTRMQVAFGALMRQKDVRMKSVTQVFGAMQIIKMNSWEDKFCDKITSERNAELHSLWRVFLATAASTTLMYLGPVLVAVTSFATYALVMGQPVTATKIFTALTLFNLLKVPLCDLPYIFTGLMQALVAVQRLAAFLNLNEKDDSTVLTRATDDAVARDATVDVAVAHATFGWDTKPLFEDVSLTIHRGELVVVHGAVGQGKSSLCLALLGEMPRTHGSVFLGGRVAYVSQQPWIQHMTIRDNILFGQPFDRTKYNRVVDACALTTDLALFPDGDRTEIGLKGVNLSGGQKARISLARACYSDADIFILDAPLAAVDAIVQQEIFAKCVLGLLRDKTVLLVTHSPEIIDSVFVDRRIELHAGNVSQSVIKKQAIDDASTRVLARAHLTNNSMAPCMLPTIHSSPGILSLSPHSNDDMSNSPSDRLLEEGRSSGRVAAHVYRAYFDALGGWPVVLYWGFVLSLWQGLVVAGDLWLSHWSSSSTVDDRRRTGFNLGIYAALSIGGAIMTIFRTLSIYGSGLRAARTLFDKMTHALLHAPMRFFDANPVGRVLNRYTGDMGTIDTTLPFCISGLVGALTNAVFALGTTFWMIQSMGLIAAPLLYIYVAIGRFYVQPAREMERVSKTAKSPLLNLISESIDGSVVIRAFGPGHVTRFHRLHGANVDAANAATLATQVTTQWFSLRMELTSAVLLFVVASSLVVLRDQLNAGLIGLAFNYVFTLLGYFERCIAAVSQLETSMVAPERIAEYARLPSEGPRVVAGAVAKAWPTTGDLCLTNVSFRYKAHDPLVLKDVNVHIRSGEKIGIVGRTGAGKSSLTMALFRINELASGSISIDGVDIATLGVHTLRKAIAIIPQTPVLFQGTLRNYLDPFDEFDDATLWASLQKVHLASRLDKLDIPVEENGDNFSVGERQMLCMARALLRQARIVVLDEATAAIDHGTDQLLQCVIRTEFATSTVLTIAHRLDTVLDADRILVLDQGQLAQCDTPNNLIAQGSGIFFDLCNEGGYMDKMTKE
ncbi:Aste57867_20937 [Aphanomyces stellatus]|uniref:Aste57867_20937 protein n=1 Tax=Aphanomyces stellatus TaxID=120398 RepID=A0A485LGY5_9STRA|nr:hypothetical protein As57867_020869 [Aphanomyces stellatus]VFT97614.1 Aste57867_20937 [Aphanomyces stellatus]